jgi:transcriptional regulator with XRE-family HTH domain
VANPWNELLRQAREGTKLTRQELAKRAGVSADIIYSYETARRAPKRDTIVRLARAMQLDGATTNAILTDAGLEPAPSPWVLEGRIPLRPFEALQGELDDYAWPCLALDERFEIIAWNLPAVRVAEMDFTEALPLPHQRNLLRIAVMQYFRARVLTWDDLVSVMIVMIKGHHVGPEDPDAATWQWLGERP